MNYPKACMLVLLISSAIFISCGTNPLSNDNPVIGTVKDIDGNVYNTVRIGNQVWTVENLKTTKYNDGTSIPHVPGSGVYGETTGWRNLQTGAYCYYDNNASNKAKYGALYNWYAVNTGKLAPKGWHIPTHEDWIELEEYLVANGYNWDGSKEINKIAKALAAKTDWKFCTASGFPGNDLSKNNRSGFSALPGGYRDIVGDFHQQCDIGYWWCATESSAPRAWCRCLYSYIEYLSSIHYLVQNGFSVRLLQD
ncbi:MAG: hypothetical protein GX640_11630 [Fibrobacter sp.]|nr:hypothetical protein [Fibrobacter sp.]